MEIAITLDHKAALPLHRQLYEELRGAILSRRLKPGERVPSTRLLARSLKLSRATVTQSYEQLICEGYLQATVGSGTTVCAVLPEELLRTSPVKTRTTQTAKRRAPAAIKLSQYGVSLNDSVPLEPPEPDLPLNFKSGRPALEEFPLPLWRRLLLRHCREDDAALLDYSTHLRGLPHLREAIASYLARSRAVRCTAEQVVIVNGSQQAIDLITKLLIDRGDAVAVENPGYLGARRAFLAQGAKLLPVPVDENGLVTERLETRLADNARLIYVTPSHQFPTGGVLPLARRLELLRWAESTGAVVVEDDYDSEFRYGSRPIPALQGLAEGANVIYIGTFSKVLFPALRIGYVVVPESLARVFARARWIADRQTPTLEQLALTDFIAEGHLERHLRRMRTLYDKRRQTLVRALNQHFAGRIEILGENAGMHLTARLQTPFDDKEAVRRAQSVGVGLVSARLYYLSEAPADEFVLGYAGLSERRIQEGVRRLAKVLR
ncbi:MAG TPA: PLP-dependent aminotransferase family protein [Blastocatellia bacterium]|nr:PLP-dependent aminotransferase family protein [Blastocatellia bacterium]HMV86460.1 PLP-dependent aminotransferase family protein [Blastocatellia bacterium]HMY73458.1 PLP-dependent aminotransferase family protein [Blastocatellia bacterium]HMZ17104.1 PLP-dependent aminotransferase family protein [Blastocatellia bacterium]HNG33735.1 PLP-dependent aminotransferase family protein [Blastocatellia bacterium]